MDDITPYLPLIIMAVNGLIAGWLASLVLGGGGLLRNLVVGIIGAFVGGGLVNAGWLVLPESIMGYANMVPYGPQILISTIGALIVIVVARLIGR
jgi:uncharacterized membrane protein YeaQ/YmgE (transglycosylase-associated protein family)